VAGQWLVGQERNNLKLRCFVERAVQKTATEQQPPDRCAQASSLTTELTYDEK